MFKFCLQSTALITATTLGAVLLNAAPASADLLEQDLFSSGDGLITFDEDTELEWLDLTATTNLSFEDVIAGAGGFTTTLGFRYATLSEVKDLFVAAGIDDVLGTPTSNDGDSLFENLTDLQSLIGITATVGVIDPLFFSNGIHLPDSGPALPAVLDVLNTASGGLVDIASFSSSTIADDDSDLTIGSFLVRDPDETPNPVPEPGTVIGVGAVALGGLLGRKQVARRKSDQS